MMKKKLLKIMILGNSGVGKTSLLQQYISQQFTGRYKVTLGADFLTKDITIDTEKMKLQIWDTAGQERYHSMNEAYYRGSDGCLLVYDVTDGASFDCLDKWVKTFLSHIPEYKIATFPIVLLGNKADQAKHVITPTMAKKWCIMHNNVTFFETSAKTRQGVEEAFFTVAKLGSKHAKVEEQYCFCYIKTTHTTVY